METLQSPQKLLTVEEFARLLDTSRTTVFHLLKTGVLQEGIHYIRLGRILRFRWMEELLFRKPAPVARSKKKKPKRPESSEKQSAEQTVNLDYGMLPA